MWQHMFIMPVMLTVWRRELVVVVVVVVVVPVVAVEEY